MSNDLKSNIVATFMFKDAPDGFHLLVLVDGEQHFDETYATAEEQQRAHDDLLEMSRSIGAVDMPKGGH